MLPEDQPFSADRREEGDDLDVARAGALCFACAAALSGRGSREGLLGVADVALTGQERDEDVPLALGAQLIDGVADRGLDVDLLAEAVTEARELVVRFEDELLGAGVIDGGKGRVRRTRRPRGAAGTPGA